MALTPRLDIRQSQTLVMTPQLQQAIKLLQMSNLELGAFVEQELERNPLLEHAESDGDSGTDANSRLESQAQSDPRPLDDKADGMTNIDNATTEYENLYPEDSAVDRSEPVIGQNTSQMTGNGGGTHFDSLDNSLEETVSEAESLQDHLLIQLTLDIIDPVERIIGRQLIGRIDEAGYLTEPLSEIANQLGCSLSQIESTLSKLQQFDPIGILARNLQECLSLQLREKDRLDPAMQTLLDHLDLLAKRDMQTLMRLCGVDAEDLMDMIAEIKALNPKPGLAFASEITQPMLPDVFVRPNPNPEGGWLVELNNDTLPKVLINNRYHAEVAPGLKTKADRAYLSECLNTAHWLVKSLDQRANTILKVASEIVRQQDSFFTHGVQYLRPLNLRTVAEAIEMHESTVSRVTSNKYISTARGIFEMRFFFSSAINSSDGGEAHAAEAVRNRIRRLIEAESAGQTLSDDRIVEILKSSGIDIARRTVAKYRESLKIPSSIQRRRLKEVRL